MERICEKLGLSKRDLLEKLLDGALNLIDVCQYEDVAIEELEACDPARAKDTSYVRVSSSLAVVRLPRPRDASRPAHFFHRMAGLPSTTSATTRVRPPRW